MHAYDPADWAGYFTAITGAAAALAGLLFVSVSINLKNILSTGKGLAGRAGGALSMLVFVVLISALALVPQALWLLGAEILVLAVPLSVFMVSGPLRYRQQNPGDPLLWLVSRLITAGCALLPALAGGISLAARGGGGLYWLVPATLLGIAGGVFSAWVLLVEIMR